jgi:hypothetical protein
MNELYWFGTVMWRVKIRSCRPHGTRRRFYIAAIKNGGRAAATGRIHSHVQVLFQSYFSPFLNGSGRHRETKKQCVVCWMHVGGDVVGEVWCQIVAGLTNRLFLYTVHSLIGYFRLLYIPCTVLYAVRCCRVGDELSLDATDFIHTTTVHGGLTVIGQ